MDDTVSKFALSFSDLVPRFVCITIIDSNYQASMLVSACIIPAGMACLASNRLGVCIFVILMHRCLF